MSNVRWIGGAARVRDKWTLTVTGTYASGDTIKVTIGNKDLIITFGASASVVLADIAAEIIAAFNATTNASHGTGFTWNYGGQEFLEFKEAIAEAGDTSDIVVIKARDDYQGIPIGLSRTVTTAGDGDITISNAIPATGPNFWDNADNWLGGVLPADNDVVYFDTGAVPCLYGLTYARTNAIDHDLYISNDWTGSLGLPAINAAGSYAEYRQRYFQYRGGSKTLRIDPGLLGNTNVGSVYIDLQDQATVAVAITANRGQSTSVPTIFLAGSPVASNGPNGFTITKGAVAIEPDDAPTDATKYLRAALINIGVTGGNEGDTLVYIGRNARLQFSDIAVFSGTLICEANTLDGGDASHITLKGGVTELRGRAAENFSTIDVHAGATLYPIGDCESDVIQLFGGTLDFRRGNGAFNPTDVKMYAGSALYDPQGLSIDQPINLVGCSLSQVTLQLPANRQLDYTIPAVP